MIRKIFLLATLFFGHALLFGTDYYVEKTGSDKNNGTAPESAKSSINAVLCLIRPGDTLTIGPGEYYEGVSPYSSLKEESTGKPILIKAKYPGSVLLRGDKEVSGKFTKVPGFRFIYVTDFPQEPHAVNERDSFRILIPSASRDELEFTAGLFYYDKTSRKLYISTSDGQSPDHHYYTASLIHQGGLMLNKASYVTLDGLMATGFYAFNRLPYGNCYGIRLNGKTSAVIRNCKAFFNSNGIHMGMKTKSVIEDCSVYANGSYAPFSGGNMVVWGDCHGNTLRRCRSFFSTHPNRLGIRFYGGVLTGNRLEDNVSFGEGGIGVKGGLTRNPAMQNICFNNYNECQFASDYGSHNVFRSKNAYSDGGGLRLDLLEKKKMDFNVLFADPENHDFRPQEGAKGIQDGLVDREDVFFVAVNGNDSNSGRSVAKPWKTLKNVKPKTTVYLIPGKYETALELNSGNVTLKTRGTGKRAILTGGLNVVGSGNRIDGMNFLNKPVRVQGDNTVISCCGFGTELTVQGKNVEIAHNVFTAVPDFSKATGFRHSNLKTVNTPAGGLTDMDYAHAKPIFSDAAKGDFTVKNPEAFAGRGFDAFPIGPYRLIRQVAADPVRGPFVWKVSDTTADIEWWTSDKNATSELRWGETTHCNRMEGSAYRGSGYHSVTLTGLQPGKTYYFRLNSKTPPREFHSNMELFAADMIKSRKTQSSATQSFRTEKAVKTAQTYYVSPNGKDTNVGTLASPMRSINAALWKAGAGDTVIVRGGIYMEQIRFRSGGADKRPLTLKTYPGEKAILDGQMVMTSMIDADNKSNIVIDGFYFQNVLQKADGAAVQINGGENILVQRCFYDGRSDAGYTPEFIRASRVRHLTMANCVIIRGFTGTSFWECPDLLIRNNVFYLNSIFHIYLHCKEDDTVSIENNIFYDQLPIKFFSHFIGIYNLDALKERSNCYYPRMQPEKKGIFRVSRLEGEIIEKRFNYPEFVKLMQSEKTSLTVNPQCPVLKEHFSLKNPPPILHEYMTLDLKWLQNKEYLEIDKKFHIETHQVNGKYMPLDFKDFFAQNPDVIKIHAGLEKELFHPNGGISK